MDNNSSKQILLSVLGVAILVVAVVGVSFAAFTFSQNGEQPNKITTGSITLNYQEGENGILINDMMPTKDDTGKALLNSSQDITGGSQNVFDFEVSANISGQATINYVVSAEKVTQDSQLEDANVRLYVQKTSSFEDATPTGTSDAMAPAKFTADSNHSDLGKPEEQMTLVSDSFTSSEDRFYRLKMWVAEDYEPEGTAKSFSVKVHVYAKAA